MGKRQRENDDKYNSLIEGYIGKMLKISKDFDPRSVSLRVAGVYALFGALWILLSDKLLELLVHDKQTMTLISLIKGWLFVVLTMMMIISLVYSTLRHIKQDKNKIDQNYRELSATYEELEATYEELSASEEELRLQHETLTESQQKLLDSEERYRLVSEAGNDGIWDERDNVRYFSDRWLEITGYSREELDSIGNWQSLIHPDDYPAAKQQQDNHLEGKTAFYCCEYRLRRKDGNYVWIQSRGKAITDGLGKVSRIAGSHTDISQIKEYQSKLHAMAYHDSLTNLPNRSALHEDIKDFLLLVNNKTFVVFYLDVDNFKIINDTHGHDFGDQILVLISQRITNQLEERASYSLYRLGGDEFIIVNKEMNGQDEAEKFAKKIITMFQEPVNIGDRYLRINISIGISLYPKHGRDINELLRCADIAMYNMKDTGGNYYKTYTESMNDSIIERMMIEEHLHNAFENNEFELYYQPQFNIMENRITGFEALLRWNNYVMGNVSPVKFIPVAEETHFIIPLGKWVLEKACTFMKELQRYNKIDFTVSVNISMMQLFEDDFVDEVFAILEENDINPNSLELEITESILMESYEVIKDKLLQLRQKGIKIALDDFGKGYSSLSYLKQLPITTLKIDKSFIDNINDNIGSKSLTKYIVMMGRELGLNVVAEGVEETKQLEYLIKNHCQSIQGYLFSKPLPEKEIIKFLHNQVMI